MTDYSLQIGASAFWGEARRDIASARRRVLIQAMTFEGDVIGQDVAAALTEASPPDRRVLVDDYTRHVINDRLLWSTRDPAVLAEATATRQMFDHLVAHGVGVRVTNPIAGNPLRYPLRNHKKLLVIDDAAWIGGINFSDHNFGWHDLMVRIEDRQVADWLAERFASDWQGRSDSTSRTFADGLELANLDGTDNKRAFAPLLGRFANAMSRIEMVSPYPTFPFVEALGAAAARGISVTLYTPGANNKPLVRDYLLGAARGQGITVRLLPEMTHSKAALIDGETLIFGSTNFDFVSYRTSAELVATIRDPAFVARFNALVFEPLRHGSRLAGSDLVPRWRELKAAAALRVADAAIAQLRPVPRSMDWPTENLPSLSARPEPPALPQRLAEGDPPG